MPDSSGGARRQPGRRPAGSPEQDSSDNCRPDR